MTYNLYIGQVHTGTVTAESEGSRIHLTATAPLLNDGIYKAFLIGDNEKLSIGIMMPNGNEMSAKRSVSEREFAALGSIQQGEAIMTVPFDPAAPLEDTSVSSVGQNSIEDDPDWLPEPYASHLFSDPSVAALWSGVQDCYKKIVSDGTLLAAVLKDEAPFSPVPMFCLGVSQTVHGKSCIVFKINPAGYPVPAE